MLPFQRHQLGYFHMVVLAAVVVWLDCGWLHCQRMCGRSRVPVTQVGEMYSRVFVCWMWSCIRRNPACSSSRTFTSGNVSPTRKAKLCINVSIKIKRFQSRCTDTMGRPVFARGRKSLVSTLVQYQKGRAAITHVLTLPPSPILQPSRSVSQIKPDVSSGSSHSDPEVPDRVYFAPHKTARWRIRLGPSVDTSTVAFSGDSF